MVKESQSINRSLFTLGKVIKELSEKKDSKHVFVPYRDSKLTMLLMDSLGGSSIALMISCVSPSHAYYDESISTLNYAQSTMNIKNTPIVQMNEKDMKIYNYQKQLDLLKSENVLLKERLRRATDGSAMDNLSRTQSKRKRLPPLAQSRDNQSENRS